MTRPLQPINSDVDYSTEAGAKKLAALVVTYWAQRGQNVQVTVHKIGKLRAESDESSERTVWGIKSSLRGGWPR